MKVRRNRDWRFQQERTRCQTGRNVGANPKDAQDESIGAPTCVTTEGDGDELRKHVVTWSRQVRETDGCRTGGSGRLVA